LVFVHISAKKWLKQLDILLYKCISKPFKSILRFETR